MKMTPFPKILTVGIGVAIAGLSFHSAQAASATWTGATDATWAGTGNWTATPVPGTGDVAGFVNSSATVNGNTTIDLGSGVTVGGIAFDTASAAAYTIGSGGVGAQTLTLTDTATVNMTSTVANDELINANVVLGTAITGTTTITNASTTNSLTIAGTITGGTGGTAGTKSLNTAGAGAINLQGTITNGGATLININNGGSGNTTLSGSGTATYGTLTATAAGTLTVNNASANITVNSLSKYGASSNFGKFILTNGTIAFNGGLSSGTSSGALAGSDGMAFIVNGGTFAYRLGCSWSFLFLFVYRGSDCKHGCEHGN
ncbi:MAG: hypothetical protein QM796_16270 [Chthoniobacteraceae bacterium]